MQLRNPSAGLGRKSCTVGLYTGQRGMEDAPEGSPMQLRNPSEGLGRKAFAHTEAVQTDSMQVST
jgi:hypothetical protein